MINNMAFKLMSWIGIMKLDIPLVDLVKWCGIQFEVTTHKLRLKLPCINSGVYS